MKTLILMRHAQAAYNAETDRLRPLTLEGRQKAVQSARQLLQDGHKPQLILCSPYLRAQQTAQLAGEILQVPPQSDVQLDGRLSAAGLVQFARQLLSQYNTVLLIGHNPAISLAAAVLSGTYTSLGAGDFAVFQLQETSEDLL